MAMHSINPATGETIQTFEETSESDVETILGRTDAAAREWSRTDFDTRAPLMRRAAEILRERADEYARLMAAEMGKPLPGGRSEIEKCAWVCDYYADHAERFLANEPVEMEGGDGFVAFRPIGVVLAVMPWNFPFWQVFRFLAPTLMAGNGGLLKHAANVQGCAVAIESVMRDAGFPEDLFKNLALPSKRVAAVIEHDVVRAVTLTGSTPAGQSVAATAGKVLKKTVLELGGSDPYVVLADADVEAAVETCVASRLINGGQSCIAAKRFIVEEPIRDEFTTRMVELMKAKTMGDPLGEEEIDLGPMARSDLRDELHDQVKRSVKEGATCLLGGEIPDGKGAFYPPTVLAGVTDGMAVYSEETFGPVATIITAKDESDALRIANDSVFGLGAAIFTGDRARGRRLATLRLDAGCCFVNDFVKSDPRLPFGGVKQSGYGRELAAFGIREFVNVKSVFVKG